MATIKIILDKRFKKPELIDEKKSIDNNLYPLKLRIFHGTAFRDIHLKYKMKESDWTGDKVKKTFSNSARVNSSIQKKYSIASTTLADYDHLIAKMSPDAVRKLVEEVIEKQLFKDQNLPDSVEHVSNRSKAEMISLREFGDVLIERKRLKGKHSTASWYDGAITTIIKFNNEKDLTIPAIDATFLENFEAYHISQETKKNSISAYLRAIRAITNAAINERLKGKKFDGYPWGVTYSIPSEKTQKRAVGKDVFEKIRKQEYPVKSAQWDAKNYLLFMFNCRGMNFIDIAKLKVKNIISGERLEYVRSKNGKPFSLALTQEAKSILSHYTNGKEPNELIFPIGFEETQKGLETYSQKRKRINKRFRDISKDATGTELPLTSYVIRHSWATIAKKKGVAIPVIGESLGHNDFKTTETYLDQFENDVLDAANELIVG